MTETIFSLVSDYPLKVTNVTMQKQRYGVGVSAQISEVPLEAQRTVYTKLVRDGWVVEEALLFDGALSHYNIRNTIR